MPSTLFDKVWDSHVVRNIREDGPDVLFIDCHFIHEVTSPVAFPGAGKPWIKSNVPGKNICHRRS